MMKSLCLDKENKIKNVKSLFRQNKKLKKLKTEHIGTLRILFEH